MVIALHVFVFGLLLLPLGAAEQAKETRHTIQVALLEPKVEPPPPPPPPEIPKQVVIKKNPPAPKPVAKPAPTPPTAPIVDATPRAVDLPADPSPPAPPVDISPPGPARGELVATVAPHPPYPPAAIRAGATGTVVLEIIVGADGVPTDVRVKKSSGNRNLDRTAQRHVRDTWRFQATWQQQVGILPINFTLG